MSPVARAFLGSYALTSTRTRPGRRQSARRLRQIVITGDDQHAESDLSTLPTMALPRAMATALGQVHHRLKIIGVGSPNVRRNDYPIPLSSQPATVSILMIGGSTGAPAAGH